MDNTVHNKMVSFIWSIADDCLRDVFVRGKYRDVILPMVVLRRIDCLLEESKAKVMEEVKFQKEEAKLADLDPSALCDASGYKFYNTSNFTLKELLNNPTNLEANFKNYLDGFSDNVLEIVDRFNLREQVRKMAAKDILHEVIEKFISPQINLTPNSVEAPDGRKMPGLSNLGMGYVFEELIRKFNEENNEEAGEHFTPREVIELMTHLVFIPVKDKVKNGNFLIYDPACGSGGMLTESQNFITDKDGPIASKATLNLYGREVNDETYAICKSDMMIKGNDPENIKPESTLAIDEFSDLKFDFMLTNPPYGKSWSTDQKHIKDGKEIIDSRFNVGTPRSSDGQLLFMMEMVSKIKETDLGSRIASVHNGSALFTGDAGGGESEIRRHLLENDLIECIIQLPNNMFYNTGITTYVWILANRKVKNRKGKVQLIDASQMFKKLRKNLGDKNCEFTPEHIKLIWDKYISLEESDQSKIFKNEDFGYRKITVERPLRRKSQFTEERISPLRFVPAVSEQMEYIWEEFGEEAYENLKGLKEQVEKYLDKEEITLSPKNKKVLFDAKAWENQLNVLNTAKSLLKSFGEEEFNNFNIFKPKIEAWLKDNGSKLSNSEKKQILDAVSWSDEEAVEVIKKKGKNGEPDIYEPDSDLRDNENVRLSEDIHDFFNREVLPHVPDAWIDESKTTIGYEISFNKYFYKHKPLRSLEEVKKDILELEKQTEGMIHNIMVGF